MAPGGEARIYDGGGGLVGLREVHSCVHGPGDRRTDFSPRGPPFNGFGSREKASRGEPLFYIRRLCSKGLWPKKNKKLVKLKIYEPKTNW